jgi:hypothetical protein
VATFYVCPFTCVIKPPSGAAAILKARRLGSIQVEIRKVLLTIAIESHPQTPCKPFHGRRAVHSSIPFQSPFKFSIKLNPLSSQTFQFLFSKFFLARGAKEQEGKKVRSAWEGSVSIVIIFLLSRL